MANYEVVLMGRADSGDILNVLHYDISLQDATVLQEMTDFIAAAFITHCQDRFVPDFQLRRVRFRPDSPGAVGVEYTPTAGPINGTATGGEYAGQLAALIRKHNDDGDRPAIGRAYVGGLATGQLTGEGLWEQNLINSLIDFWEAIRDINLVVSGETAQMLIKASNPTAPNTSAYVDVDRITGGVNPVTQKSRKRGVGS